MQDYFDQACQVTPGGVHSPVRSFKGLDRPPVFFQRGEGAYLFDHEGQDYIDFCMSFGPLILGHQNETVKKDLHEALERGWTFGACEPYSLRLAQFITSRIPWVEQIRFVNSGTEAVMTALRLARGITKKEKVLKFNGCYHGHIDSLLIKSGSGLAGTSEASSEGITKADANNTLVLELGDEKGVREIIEREELAAIIIEPLPANYGLLPQPQEFLEFLREITSKHGVLLIFDEVISGFRVAFGGMAEVTGVAPDLVTYGKIIGGGLPVGAVGGAKKLMGHLAPEGGVYQAGTLSANPLAMIAGFSTLGQLVEGTYDCLKVQTENLVSLLSEWMAKENPDYQIIQNASLFWPYPSKQRVSTVAAMSSQVAQAFRPIFLRLLEKKVYLSPAAFEVGFLSLAHDNQVLEELKKRLWK